MAFLGGELLREVDGLVDDHTVGNLGGEPQELVAADAQYSTVDLVEILAAALLEKPFVEAVKLFVLCDYSVENPVEVIPVDVLAFRVRAELRLDR